MIGNSSKPVTQDTRIAKLLRDYYTRYYRDQLGLTDWSKRVQWRLKEEQNTFRFIKDVESWFNYRFNENVNVLVVGGGTGAEFIAFSQLGCNAYAIEPNVQAVSIGQLKAIGQQLPPERFLRGFGEELPFKDCVFDFVWCHAVLEHVNDVEACVTEIVRVTKPHGYAFIHTPDYRQFHEPHYKLTLPMFLPKWLIYMWLWLIGRPPAFLRSLQFVDSQYLTNLFQNQPVVAFRIIHSWPKAWKDNPSLSMRLVKWMTQYTGIHRDQYWVLQKLEKSR